MKIIRLVIVAATLGLASCDKVDSGDRCGRVNLIADPSEFANLQAFISSNGISAVPDERGFFYTIVRNGTGPFPNVCSQVSVSYTGRLTNGLQFDAANGISLNLQNVIIGWQEGVPLVAEGGSIVLYLPPSLGYGSQGAGSIPANSITIFQIDLLKVN